MSEDRVAALARMRLFFALWPPDDLRERIESTAREWVAAGRGRRIAQGNLHVTVVFIGEVQESQLGAIAAAADATHTPVFTLRLDAIQSWPESKVLVLTASSTPPPLLELVDGLRFNLLRQHVELKRQLYQPHVTLARDQRATLPTQSAGPIIWPVDQFVLVRSRPGVEGPVYEVLDRWSLRAPV